MFDNVSFGSTFEVDGDDLWFYAAGLESVGLPNIEMCTPVYSNIDIRIAVQSLISLIYEMQQGKEFSAVPQLYISSTGHRFFASLNSPTLECTGARQVVFLTAI